MLYLFASLPRPTISSWQPSGKLIAEPTTWKNPDELELPGEK
jgi:hypothetical protein